MRKSKLIIANFILLIVVGIILFAYKFSILNRFTNKTEQNSQSYAQILAKILENAWIVGPELKNIGYCLDLDQNAPIEFYRCNPEYLKCFLKKEVTVLNSKFRGRLIDEDKLIVEFISSSKNLYRFKLEDRCHMTYLPQNYYTEGDASIENNIWDNFHENVYIDKYYVSNKDVKKWNPKLVTKNDYQANTSLDLNQKRQYCASIGKSLLEARYFDAASFLHLQDPETKYFYKGRNHFKKGSSFLNNLNPLTFKDCNMAYVLGCEKFFTFNNFQSNGLTWMGINYALGAQEEIFINRFDSKRNYKVSSMSLEKNNPSHLIGLRENSKNRKGAFRCMLRL